MVKCKNCGEEIKDKNFCPKCGTKNETTTCPACNSELQEDDIFCPECGEKIKDDETEEESSEEKSEEIEEDTDKDEEKETEEESSEEKSEEDTDKKDEEKETDDKEEDADNDKEETKEDSDKKDEEKKEVMRCPHCDTKIYEEDAEYCLECGKPINIDIQSFAGVKSTIQVKKLIIFSIISIIFSAVIALLLSYIFGMASQTTDLYPIGFFISLLIVVGIFGSFKDLVNGGLLGIITGLVIGLLCNLIVELSAGFAFSYQMFSGYAPIVFTIFGAIVGVISTKYFRNSISKRIDVEELF